MMYETRLVVLGIKTRHDDMLLLQLPPSIIIIIDDVRIVATF
jgi:hypothetical protein